MSTSARVWAPRATGTDLQSACGRTPMREGHHGWWHSEIELANGEDYGFWIDGNGPLPDPRSPSQPHGVHGLSRWVDHGAFAWHDAGWQAPPLASALIYELHIGTFTAHGTFEGVAEKLDHLKTLGVTHLQLMPVAEFSGTRGWGYDGVDLFAPHHAYGGPNGLKQLVDSCHARGFAVLLDVVYNHLGPDGNYLARFGPYFSDRYRTPWGEAVNFDGPGSDEVRRFFIDNALMWLTHYHLDGLRIDAVHAMHDRSAQHFLEQLTTEVHALQARLRRHLVVIAESDLNDPRLLYPVSRGGFGMDAQWNEDFHHALHAALTGERSGYFADFGALADVAAALTHGYVYDGRYSAFRRRRHGRPAEGLSLDRFIGCLQNHDQVGNRAQGDRIGNLLSPGMLMIGAALVLCSPFVPMLFQGEEWNASSRFAYFTSHHDPSLAAAVRDGRRREFTAFGWHPQSIPDPQALSTFQDSVLDWDEPAAPEHAPLFDWYRRLIMLRRQMPALTAGTSCAVRYDEAARWLICERGAIHVACNLAAVEQTIAFESRQELLACSRPDFEMYPDRLHLPAESVAVLRGA